MTVPTRSSRQRDERGVVAPSRLMIVVIVVVAIGAAMFFATAPGKDDTVAASDKPAATKTTAAASPSASASSSADPTPSAEPTPTPTPTPSATPEPTQAPAPAQAVNKAKTTVAVFNNSGRKGLAKRTAAKVTGAGWKVSGTDNWYGSVPSTTVYFPKKMKAAAQALAADLGIRRVKAAQAPMRNDRLTLILTADYAS